MTTWVQKQVEAMRTVIDAALAQAHQDQDEGRYLLLAEVDDKILRLCIPSGLDPTDLPVPDYVAEMVLERALKHAQGKINSLAAAKAHAARLRRSRSRADALARAQIVQLAAKLDDISKQLAPIIAERQAKAEDAAAPQNPPSRWP